MDDDLMMTRQERAQMGGRATRQRRDRAWYAEIGSKGGRATVERYGREHFSQIGRRGGRPRNGDA